jgi:hypothetical protein
MAVLFYPNRSTKAVLDMQNLETYNVKLEQEDIWLPCPWWILATNLDIYNEYIIDGMAPESSGTEKV